jgi:hypothetical protein
MLKRITLPGLFDLVWVDDPQHMAWLNAHPSVTRSLNPSSGLLQRLLNQRLAHDLRFERGVLPVFSVRGASDRARKQVELRGRLERHAGKLSPEVIKLANYVAGLDDGRDLAVIVQQWCGRLIFDDYCATRETVRAGDVIGRWPSFDPARAALYRYTGALARHKRVLEQAARGDLHCVHGTSIGMRNLVESVRTLRRLAREPHKRELHIGDRAVLLSLIAPAAVVRGCTDDVRASFLARPLTAQSLIVFPLHRMFDDTRDPDVAFMSTSWNACPARAAVLGLLASVWELATGTARPVPPAAPRSGARGGNGASTHGAARS